ARRERRVVLSEVAVTRASNGHFKEALQALESLEAGGLRDITAGRIAVIQEEAGKREGAAQAVNYIVGPDQRLSALIKVATVQHNAGNRAAAIKTAAQAVELVSSLTDPYKKATGWTEIGQVRAKIGEQSAAQEAFRQARKTVEESSKEIDR